MDECGLGNCKKKLPKEPIEVTFTLGDDVMRTIKVCEYHGDLIKVTTGFSIGPDITLVPIPAYPKGKK